MELTLNIRHVSHHQYTMYFSFYTSISSTVEAWYKGRNGTFESVPLYQAIPYIGLWLFLLPFQPNIIWYIPIKALLHSQLFMLPSYTIITTILHCNWQNFNYLDIFHTEKMVGEAWTTSMHRHIYMYRIKLKIVYTVVLQFWKQIKNG